MTKIYFLTAILIVSLFGGCVKEIKNNDSSNEKAEFALVIHGGAGNIYEGKYSKEKEAEYISKLTEALNVGYDILENNGSSVDAVESVIRVMEDSPLFNSGKGAVFTNEGNGAVLAVFRKTELGFVFVDEFTSFFYRNRIVFSVSNPFTSANHELFFRLEWRAYMGGYCVVESDESSYLEASEISSYLIMVTDGEFLRTEYDHRPATPLEE